MKSKSIYILSDKSGLRGCFDSIDAVATVLKKNKKLGQNCNLFRVPLNDYDLGLDKESPFIKPIKIQY